MIFQMQAPVDLYPMVTVLGIPAEFGATNQALSLTSLHLQASKTLQSSTFSYVLPSGSLCYQLLPRPTP